MTEHATLETDTTTGWRLGVSFFPALPLELLGPVHVRPALEDVQATAEALVAAANVTIARLQPGTSRRALCLPACSPAAQPAENYHLLLLVIV